MTRFVSNSTGALGDSGENFFASVTAGEAIQAGDLVTQASDGLAWYAVDPQRRGAVLRPLALPATTVNTAVVPAFGVGETVTNVGNVNLAQCVLANGNVVLVWIDKTAPYNVQFAIYDNLGQRQGGIGVVGTAKSPTNEIAVCATPSGGFAIAYCSSTDDPKFAAFSSTGAVVVAATTVQAAATGVISIAITALSNGNLAVVYRAYNGSMYEPRVAVFSAAGAVVKAATVLVVPTTNVTGGRTVAICTLTGGGFVAAWHTTSGTSGATSFQRFDNAGAAQGAATTPAYNTAQTGFTIALPLTGGGFVLAAYGSNQSGIATVYNSAGVMQGAQLAIDTTGSYNGQLALAELTSGEWIAVWFSSGIKARKFSAAGVALGAAAVTLAAAGAVGSVPYLSVAATGDGGAVVAFSGSSYLTVAVVDNALNLRGPASATDIPLSGNGLICLLSVFPSSALQSTIPTYLLSGIAGSAVTACVRASSIPARAPIGVAAAAAAAGNALSVQITGQVELREGFVQPVSMDANSACGQRMLLLGKTALLFGLMSATKRNIN